MTALETSMADLCATQNLRTIGVQHFAAQEFCPMFYCINLHWAPSGHTSGTGDTIAEAMALAMASVAERRTAVLADEALELAA